VSGTGCDVEERCNGTTKNCPNDAVQPSTHACRPATGLCDIAELCPCGNSKDCPAQDAIRQAGYQCHPAIDQCDAVEICDGDSKVCPTDMPLPAGTECFAESSGEACDDFDDVCDGLNRHCPDAVLKEGAQCHHQTSGCDFAEVCDGKSDLCPDNTKEDCAACCSPRSTAGCGDPAIERCVCENNPSCCDGQWSADCVAAAVNSCGANCGSTCCLALGRPGCDTQEVQSCVCEMDPFCCETDWDEICVEEAAFQCRAECGGPRGDTCCAVQTSAGCSEKSIQACVCDFDPLCCDSKNGWDQFCVQEAIEVCGAMCN
jgi:hypothetical protein